MILRDALDIRRGTAQRNKIYKGTYKVWDRNKIALEGYCKQNTTEGYNILNFNVMQDSRVTVNDDGTITINGTSNGFIIEFEPIIVEQGKTYSTYIELVEGSYTAPNRTGLMSPLGKGNWILDGVQDIFTTQENINRHTIWCAENAVYNNAKFKIWVYEGTETKPFEKYTGGQPSPSPDFEEPIEVMQGRQVVTIESKNKFDKNNTNNFMQNMTLDNDGNVVSTTTNPTASNFISTYIMPCKPNTKYSIQRFVSTKILNIYETNISNLQIGDKTNYLSNREQVTTSGTAKYLLIKFYNTWSGEQNSYDDVINNMQIVEGEPLDIYVPYKNEQYTVDLKSKNLWKFEASYSSTAYARILDEVEYKLTKGTYKLSFENMKIDSSDLFRFFNADKSKYYDARVTNVNKSPIFTLDEDIYYVSLIFNGADNLTNIQLEEGTETTPYEPHYDYKLSGIGDYKDNFYIDKGKWYFKQNVGKVVLDGSEEWSRSSVSNNYAYFLTVYKKIIESADSLCNYFQYTNIYGYDIIGFDTVNVHETFFHLRIGFGINTAITDVTNCKNWLAEHNLEVYCPLATPTVEEITAPTLINQLNALYQAM